MCNKLKETIKIWLKKQHHLELILDKYVYSL